MSTPTRPRHPRYVRADRRARLQHLRRVAAAQPVDRTEDHWIEMALDGLLVAEELPTKARERLFTELWAAGWTDREMAEHTRTTEYTVDRIRTRLGLLPNPARPQEMTA